MIFIKIFPDLITIFLDQLPSSNDRLMLSKWLTKKGKRRFILSKEYRKVKEELELLCRGDNRTKIDAIVGTKEELVKKIIFLSILKITKKGEFPILLDLDNACKIIWDTVVGNNKDAYINTEILHKNNKVMDDQFLKLLTDMFNKTDTNSLNFFYTQFKNDNRRKVFGYLIFLQCKQFNLQDKDKSKQI